MPLALPNWGRSELIDRLRRCSWRTYFLDGRARSMPLEAVLRGAVAYNTFRAFHNCPTKPSVAFRDWAGRTFDDAMLQRVADSDSACKFDAHINSLGESLREDWARVQGHPMPYGPSMKMPGLILKMLCGSKHVPEDRWAAVAQHLHVALDSYTLAAIRASQNEAATSRIARRASMGSVVSTAQYVAIQSTIRAVAAEAGVPPITVDIVAWDGTH